MLVGISLLVSCEQDEQFSVVIDNELQVYFESFRFEGENRGLIIDLEDAQIQGNMQVIDDQGIVGQCIHDDVGKSIVIDSEKWQSLDQLEKEFIVFHELGHCFLDRGHTDTRERSGACRSIMHSSTTVCQNIYNSRTRSDYLDELFLN